MRPRERYVCQNPDCRCEVVVVKTSMEATRDPICCCGAKMKKAYAKPVLRVLDAKPTVFSHLRPTKE
jgi:hypothetical protein